MKRRELVKYAGAGFLASLGLGIGASLQTVRAQSSGVTVRWLGHTSFLFAGDGRRLLVNPFRTIGCTAGYQPITVEADLVMISSRLFDEGYLQDVPGNPQVMAEPGTYSFGDLTVQGTLVAHDRENGRRFGENVIWKWNQGGMNIVHMGGAAAPIAIEEQILLGRPDVLLLPVGGGPKAYNAEEAAQTVRTLQPKLVIPTHYRTQAADPENCDIEGLDEFLSLMQGLTVNRANGDTVNLQASNLPTQAPQIQLFSYPF